MVSASSTGSSINNLLPRSFSTVQFLVTIINWTVESPGLFNQSFKWSYYEHCITTFTIVMSNSHKGMSQWESLEIGRSLQKVILFHYKSCKYLHISTASHACWVWMCNEIKGSSHITTPQDAHKRLVLQIVQWLTDLLSGLARRELTDVQYCVIYIHWASSHSLHFSPWLQDKIWEWPGDEASVESVSNSAVACSTEKR